MAMEGLLSLFAGILGLLVLDAVAAVFGADTRDLGPSAEYKGEE
jgi:hypothetical protein